MRIGFILTPLAILLLGAAPCAAQPSAPPAAVDSDATASSHRQSKFIDPQDGWFDIDAFLDTGYGFVPIVVPVTEPAVGYGAAAGFVFIHRNEPSATGRPRRPGMSAVGGMGTENGTWMALAGDSRSWRDDQYQTLAAGLYGSIDLDFHGIGEGPLNDNPVHYEIAPAGGFAQLRRRLGDSPVQIGMSYAFISFDASFDDDELPPQIEQKELESRVAGVVPAVVYDARNNLFTPTRGVYGDLNFGLFSESMGGTSNYETISATVIYFHPLPGRVFLGACFQGKSSFDDVPFYARPFIKLRGAPVMRYLGEHAASLELEARWQFWRRISLVGFMGEGIAWTDLERGENEQTVTTGGGGFRYQLARRHGLHMGVDVAWSPDDFALYVQFGNAWFRP
jgi:Omp85 superfamily domain